MQYYKFRCVRGHIEVERAEDKEKARKIVARRKCITCRQFHPASEWEWVR